MPNTKLFHTNPLVWSLMGSRMPNISGWSVGVIFFLLSILAGFVGLLLKVMVMCWWILVLVSGRYQVISYNWLSNLYFGILERVTFFRCLCCRVGSVSEFAIFVFLTCVLLLCGLIFVWTAIILILEEVFVLLVG